MLLARSSECLHYTSITHQWRVEVQCAHGSRAVIPFEGILKGCGSARRLIYQSRVRQRHGGHHWQHGYTLCCWRRASSGHLSGRCKFSGSARAIWPATSTSSAQRTLVEPHEASRLQRERSARETVGQKLDACCGQYAEAAETFTARACVHANYCELPCVLGSKVSQTVGSQV